MLSCDIHDYIEIACTYKYPIKLTFKQGDVLECTAWDTKLNDRREECIAVKIEKRLQLIPVKQIYSMQAGIDNPHFTLIKFN